MSSITLRIAKERVLVIEGAITEVEEEWKVASREAACACDVEGLVAESISTANDLKASTARFDARFKLNLDLDSTSVVCAHQFGALLDRMVSLIPRVMVLSNDVRQRGYDVKDVSDLAILEHELKALSADFRQRWRLPTKQRIEASKKAIAEGRYRVL
jgi:hypothetical protein